MYAGARCAKVSGMELGPNFRIDQRTENSATVVVVHGEVDVHTAPQLGSALEVAIAVGKAVVVDCTSVPFMDSTGLSVFVAARNQTEEAGTRLAIVLTEPAVRKVFSITGLDTVMSIHDTLDGALAAE